MSAEWEGRFPEAVPMSRVLVSLAALALLAGPSPSPASPVDEEPQRFRSFSLAFTGGFQGWSLTGLEETIADRAALYEAQGYELQEGDFPLTYSYGAEAEFRLTETLFLRAQLEWTRLKWDDRDRQFLSTLGGRSRTPISLTFESRVQTHPLLFGVGAGAARELTSVRFAISGNLLVVPVKVIDNVTLSVVESKTESEIVATGTGVGFELDGTVDYLTDVRSTLFAEAFWRVGSTTVELENRIWESSAFPGKRDIEFDGIGIRLGLRWI